MRSLLGVDGGRSIKRKGTLSIDVGEVQDEVDDGPLSPARNILRSFTNKLNTAISTVKRTITGLADDTPKSPSQAQVAGFPPASPLRIKSQGSQTLSPRRSGTPQAVAEGFESGARQGAMLRQPSIPFSDSQLQLSEDVEKKLAAVEDLAANKQAAALLSPRYDNAKKNKGDSEILVPHNPWEWQDSYDEKVDIWQVRAMPRCATSSMSEQHCLDDALLLCLEAQSAAM